MNSRPLRLFWMFCFFAFFQSPQNVLAQTQCYILSGWKWSSYPVTYNINSNLATPTASQQDFETNIELAALKWNAAGSNFQFNQGDDVDYDKGFEPLGVYQVGWYINNSQDHAVTLVTHPGGVITNVETYFNEFYDFSTNPTSQQVDILSTALHEFGHWLVLNDETNSPCSNNVMYNSLAMGDISRRALTADDIYGILAIYGLLGTTGVHDYIAIYGGPAIITQNSNEDYWANFVNNIDFPYTDYIVGYYSWSLEVQHGEGTYVAASGTTTPYVNPWHLTLGTLPYGYYWFRDGSGNVRGTVTVSGTDNVGYYHTASFGVGITGVPYNTTSGALTHNETWGDINTLTGSITVPPSITLKILPGATVKFPSNASLTINGVLQAAGILQSQIWFTSISGNSPGSWGSIVLSGSGAAGSTLNYVNMQYGYEIDALNTSNITIQNCTIQNCINGIYAYSTTTGLIQNNTIRNVRDHGINLIVAPLDCFENVITKSSNWTYYHSGGGIICQAGSSGLLWRNDIRGFNWGIGAIWGSSPDFRRYVVDETRNNRITESLVGVQIYQQSYPVIGTPPPSPYKSNSIYNNSPYNVSFTSGGTPLAAYGVYWGWPINTSLFYASSGSTIYYIPSLSNDPWYGIPLPSVVHGGGEQIVSNGKAKEAVGMAADQTNALSNGPILQDESVVNAQPAVAPSLLDGIELRLQGKFKEAKDFFLSYIAKNPDNQAAYVELYNCYNDGTAKDITNFFRSLPKSAAKEHALLLSYLHLKQGDVKSAKQINNEVISRNPNTPLGTKAKLNNFYIALYNENDPNGASRILDEISNGPPLLTPMELSIAQDALDPYLRGRINQPSESLLSALSQQHGLSQNYPNPFNPTTTIAYRVTQPGRVSLKIFDVLGREVATLVNANQSEGVYTQRFDASDLSSGIYFYQLIAPGVNDTRKMLIAK